MNRQIDDGLGPEDEAFLLDLETLLEAEAVEPLPADLEQALRRQTRDRMKPERFSASEVLILALIGVVSLGLAGGHAWTPGQIVLLLPALIAYCAATLVFAAQDRDD